MDPITPRNRSRPGEADAYWRRRLFALAAGLAVFGLLAWAVGGASGTRQAAATTALSTPPPQPTVTPVTVPSATPSPTPSPAGTAGSRGKHARKAPAKAAGARGRHAAAAVKAGPRRGSGCPVSDVVLTLTASSNSYGPRERPAFGVSVVSTDSQTCTLDTGSRHLALVIESGGVRVWGSADCAGRSGASDIKRLTRGVPLQLSYAWNRTLSAPGCRGAKTAARPGMYTVTASDGRLHSRTEVFVLR
jgi:hypothetical protein